LRALKKPPSTAIQAINCSARIAVLAAKEDEKTNGKASTTKTFTTQKHQPLHS